MREYQYILSYSDGISRNSETLTVNPAGWDNIGVTFERNMVYMSVLRNLSLTLRFGRTIGGGYDFILAAYNELGIYAEINITISKRNPATNDYDLFYAGILDLTPNRFTIERNYIEVPIIDSKKLQLFKSREENEINLFGTKSIDDVDLTPFEKNYSVELTPVDVYLNAEFNCGWFSRQSPITGEVTVLSWPYDWPSYSKPLTITRNEIGSDFAPGTSEVIYTNNSTSDVVVKVIIDATISGNGTIFNGSAAFQFSIAQRFHYGTYYSGGTIAEEYNPLYNSETAAALETKNYDFSQPFSGTFELTVPANGGYFAIFNEWQGSGGGVVFDTSVNIYDTSSIDCKIELDIIGETASDCECLFPFEAFTRALQIITSETDTSKILDSTIFGRTDSEFVKYDANGDYCYDAIFTGRMARQYPDVPFNVKLKDLFQSFRSLYNIGLGFDNENDRFYIENVAEFFNASYIMFDLGEVANLKITPLNEGYFNKITSGFDNEGDYEEAQGAYEFAVKREYSTPTPVKEEYNSRSKYRCDSVGIEFTRKKQYLDTASEDYRDDETVFIVRTDGTNPVLDSTATGIAGIEKYYNTMLTPRQNTVRHGNLIAATLFRKSDGIIKAQATNKQFELTVNGVDENSDISADDLGSSLIIPELYEFDSYVTTTIINILLQNPHGFIRFSNFGTTYEGYLMGLETGDYNKKAKYRLVGRTVIPTENKTFEDGENFIFEDNENYIFEY